MNPAPNALAALLLAATGLGCEGTLGRRLAEQEIRTQESFDLPWADHLAILIILDDTEITRDVWGRLTNGSKAFYGNELPFGIRFLSTYLADDGSVIWMDGGHVVDQDAEWDGAFAHEFNQTLYPYIRDREILTPRPRDVLRTALDTDEVAAFVDDSHLVVLMVSALHDHSEDSDAQRAHLREQLASQPFGASVILVTPQSDRCRAFYSNYREGHDITRQVLADALVADIDVCDHGWMGPATKTIDAVNGRQNHLDVELAFEPLPATLQVLGVSAGDRVPIPASQWSLDGARLQVGPPLQGMQAIDVVYEREVGKPGP